MFQKMLESGFSISALFDGGEEATTGPDRNIQTFIYFMYFLEWTNVHGSL